MSDLANGQDLQRGAAGDGDAGTDDDVGVLQVLLVEDDAHAARTIERGFASEGVRVTVARTLVEATTALQRNPSVYHAVLLDLRLPDGRGEALLPAIEACSPQPAVLITSAFLPELEADALEYRPAAVAKPVTPSVLLRMVRVVAEGYARPVIRRFVKQFGLSKREAEVMSLVAGGLKPKEIGDRLSCSEKTVYSHLTQACAKAGCSDYHALVARLFQFSCQCRGRTEPELETFVGAVYPPRRPR
jgi:DNA-binding NarL/FixJ family response regulator